MMMKKFWIPIMLVILAVGNACKHEIPYILIANDATPLERLAANEIRRYIYLRSGSLCEIVNVTPNASQLIVISKKGKEGAPSNLENDELYLKSQTEGSVHKLVVSGGTDQAILYAAYELAEQMGIRFYLHGDVVPDKKEEFIIPNLSIRRKPGFTVRGIQPFHDFPEGPDWWNANDYRAIFGQLTKMKMNFFGLHCYPDRKDFNGDGHKAEPLVWIGLKNEHNDDGTVNAAYPVLHFVTNDSTWGYFPVKTSDFSGGAAQIFETDVYGADYMNNMSPWPHSDAENRQIFNSTGSMFQNVFEHARKIRIGTQSSYQNNFVYHNQFTSTCKID